MTATCAMLADEEVRSILLGTSGLSVLLVIASVVTWRRPLRSQDHRALERVVDLFLVGIAAQCAHLVEEFTTDFHELFPALFGLSGWSHTFMIAFNVTWIAIWLLAAVGLRRGYRWALLPIWFFALGMTANGVAHPVMSVRAGGYFPGLWTAPLVGILGAMLCWRLYRITCRPRA